MEPMDPLSQLASCCFGRQSRNTSYFKTAAVRNQFLYSPSMAHMSQGSGGAGWPMTASGIPPTTIITGALHPQLMPTQPYILLTQPVIVNSSGQLESLQANNQGPTLAILQQGQMSAIRPNGEPARLRKVPSMMPSQYNIYAATERLPGLSHIQAQQPPMRSLIYQAPVRHYGQPNGISRNMSGYLDQQHQQSQTRLNTELYKRLEIVEKQVDLSEDMNLVERHGIVITRPIEPITLAPHLTNEMLAHYESHSLLDEEHIIKFIEIIKRPGQTLGLYIRAVHFENPKTRLVREGIVITKIESDSPVYTSRVLHIGDEILSINLIDIQGMVLDDVVTLMSIPKRLVLVLRVPIERDDQEPDCEMLKQGEGGQEPPSHQSRGQSQVYNKRMVHRMIAAHEPEIHKQNVEGFDQRLAQIPGKLVDSEGARGQPLQAHLHQPALARPAGLDSSIIENLSDEITGDANFRAAMTSDQPLSGRTNASPFMTNLQKTGLIRQSADRGSSEVRSNELRGNIHMQGRFEQSRSQNVSRLDRQIAISQSTEISRSEDLEKFHNYSMDPEIAKLERDALIRDRPSDVEDSNSDRLDEQNQNQRYSSLGTIQSRKVEQTSSTLPRRALPNRPDQMSSPAGSFSPVSSVNPTVISHIRLGETSEQSNYFTSSIDAINRELKDLRRQRLAMTPCNESAPTDALAENAGRNFE